MQQHTHRTRALADARPNGPERAMQDDTDRTELQRLHVAMCPADRRRTLGSRAGRFNEIARGRWNPMWDLVADARACAVAGQPEAAILAPFEALLAHARAAVRSAQPLPSVPVLAVEATKEQGERNVAVIAYVAEPDDSAAKEALCRAALKELCDDLAAGERLRDRLREDRVLMFRRPLTLVR